MEVVSKRLDGEGKREREKEEEEGNSLGTGDEDVESEASHQLPLHRVDVRNGPRGVAFE